MTESFDDEALRVRLRAADPASFLPAATPDGAARLLEETMSHDIASETSETSETSGTGARRRGAVTWMVAAAAAVVIAGGGLFAVLHDPGDEPVGTAGPGAEPSTATTVTELTAPGDGTARCQVPQAAIIAGNPVAFDGTVQSIDGGVVTLSPTRWYAGEATDLVTVEAPPEALRSLLISVRFEEGGRYLVTSSDGQTVMVCGFSAPYSDGLATLYAEAFGG